MKPLPPGIPDPIYLHELALELRMTVAELTHGRGARMSAHELGVEWPAFYRWKQRNAGREAKKREGGRR